MRFEEEGGGSAAPFLLKENLPPPRQMSFGFKAPIPPRGRVGVRWSVPVSQTENRA